VGEQGTLLSHLLVFMSAAVVKSAVGRLFLCAFVTSIVCLSSAAQSARESLASADRAMRAGRFADAARQYEAWLRARPNSKDVLLALGICYVQLGRNEEAVATLRKYVKLVPESASGHAALGIALLDGTRTTQAKAELERALQLNPKQIDAAQALARIYLLEGQANQAVAMLQAFAPPEGNEELWVLLGEALIQTGQATAAQTLLERVLATNPRSAAQTYALAAWANLKSGHLARAAEICEEGMRIYPDSEIEGVYLSLPAAVLAERIAARIQSLKQKPDVAEMVALGRVLVDADPARKTRANEIAQQVLVDAIELAPDNASAHYNYGRALSPSSTARALEQWEKALRLNPDDELRLKILIKIAAARLELSDYAAADLAFKAALEINRKLPRRNPEAALEYVRFLELRSRPAEAEALLNEILRWNPLSPQAHLERAKLMAARGQWREVVEEGEFVLRGAGGDLELLAAAHALLARAYHRLNQPEKAQWHRSWLESH
jgi:tetratricopeptide (TPR) repeat protein